MRRLVLGLVFLTLLVLPASAGAATYCVPGPCAGGTSEPTIQAAVTAADAAADPDVVSIGAGTFNVGTGVQVDQPTTEVHGAGMTQTIVTGDPFPLADPGTGRVLISGQLPRLSDLTLRLGSAVTSGNSIYTGVSMSNGVIENLRVDSVGATFGSDINDGFGQAIDLRQGTIRNVVVDIPQDADAAGIRIGGTSGNPTQVEGASITAPTGIESDPEAQPDPVLDTVRRVVIHSPRPLTVSDGMLELRDSILDASAAPGFAEFSAAAEVLDGRTPDPAGLTMDRVTLIGSGAAGTAALKVDGQGGVPRTFLRARHIAVDGFDRSLAWANFGSNPIAAIDDSAIDLSPAEVVNANPPSGALTGNFGPGNRAGDPLFGNDLTPALTSPAVDIGGADLLAGEATDLRGNPRPVDGNGDGSVLNDAGAIERQYDGASVRILSRKVKLNRRGTGGVAVACPDASEQPPPCTVSLRIETARKVRFKGKKRTVVLARTKPATVAGGQTKKLKVRVRGAKLKLVQGSAKARGATVDASVADGDGETGSESAALKVKPKKPR